MAGAETGATGPTGPAGPAGAVGATKQRENVVTHVERQLARIGNIDPVQLRDQLRDLYRQYLKLENRRLEMRHRAGAGGRVICARRAHLVDFVARHVFENCCAIEAGGRLPAAMALVADGGYGRAELNPFSDIDLMFLLRDRGPTLPPAVARTVERVLHMLWDVGFKVGHSTRSIPDAIGHANGNMLDKTKLLEARLVAGDGKLFDEFRAEFDRRCVRGHEKEYIAQRVENQAERHAKYGSTVFMQEPHLKNGCGGLRDYQNLLWVAFFKERVMTTAALQERGLLSASERSQLEKAYDFLLRVRSDLHYLNGRATDNLTMSWQFRIADRFGYPGKTILRRSEAFMRDYYRHARAIFILTGILADRLSVSPPRVATGLISLLPGRRKPPAARERFDGFEAADGRLAATAADIFDEDPQRLMRMFRHTQTRGLTLRPDLQQLVRAKVRLVNREFQYARAAREVFAEILAQKGAVGRVLRMMHEVDFLGRYIPEFGRLTCLVQHEFFHRYTADEHTLVCVEKLDAVLDPEQARFAGYRDLFRRFPDPYILYLALLLHDTGKAANARHHAEESATCAQRVAARLQLLPARRRMLIQLVDHHLTMSMTAQRRSVEDPATAIEFAGVVRDQETLDAMMLLTLADGLGTGDAGWSDWKESLVWELYHNTAQYLAMGDAFHEQWREEQAKLREAVRRKLPAEFATEIDAHFAAMPDSYFRVARAPDVIGHIRLFRQLLETCFGADATPLAPVCRWLARPTQGHSEVWVCTWDRPHLMARIAGAFAVAHLNILSADIFTRRDNLVLDIFRVCDSQQGPVADERVIGTFEKTLRQSLAAATFDFAPLLAKARQRGWWHGTPEIDFPTRISILPGAHPLYTVVEIQAPDRLGLLHDILTVLSATGVNIVFARITTEKGAAIDSFYVSDLAGHKIDDERSIARLQESLRAAVETRG